HHVKTNQGDDHAPTHGPHLEPEWPKAQAENTCSIGHDRATGAGCYYHDRRSEAACHSYLLQLPALPPTGNEQREQHRPICASEHCMQKCCLRAHLTLTECHKLDSAQRPQEIVAG